ncbi:MAG: glutathione S-transferase [Myxococcota bacterium]
MLTVHHLDDSRSQRVLWLLEELGVPYEIEHYRRHPSTMLAPPELRKVHPLGKSPVVTDDGPDGRITVAESGAILEYLVETYGDGRLVPPVGTQAHRDYRYWLHFAEGSAMGPLLMKLLFSLMPKRSPWVMRPVVGALSKTVVGGFIDPQITRHLAFAEETLTRSVYFAGAELTAADVQMSFPIQAALARSAKPGQFPKLEAFVARIEARPAYKRALERGGPFKILQV